MAVNSYKQDEHSTDVGKMKTLMRLFSYLLDYKKEILAVLAIMAFCVFVSLCLLYTSPSPRDGLLSRMPSSA